MTAEVTLRIPAHSRFIATARVTAASIAAEFDFSIDEIEALRVGVNELAAVLIEWAEDHGCTEIELACAADADALKVRGSVVGAGAVDPGSGSNESASLDVLTESIFAGVVDDHRVDGFAGHIVKRRSLA